MRTVSRMCIGDHYFIVDHPDNMQAQSIALMGMVSSKSTSKAIGSATTVERLIK